MMFFLTMAQATPPIPVGWAVLQTLGVIVVAFLILAVVMSHLRYQNELKRVEAVKGRGMSTDNVRLWVLERIRKSARCLILFRCEQEEQDAVLSLLRENVRSEDELLAWRGAGVLMLFAGDDGLNADRAGLRLGRLLAERGGSGGVVTAVSPSPPPLKGLLECSDGLLEGLRKGDMPVSGWALPVVPPDSVSTQVSEQERPLLDEVTGVLRPERVPTAVQKILAGHRRRETPVSLMLLELDDPHVYEDVHEDGAPSPVKNGVLKAAADCLMRHCRETDLVGRMSDTRFVLVLPGDAAVTKAVAERILDRVREETVELAGAVYRYTLSVGVAGSPEHGVGPRHLFTACGEALDAAKGRGRGQVQVYSPALRRPASSAGTRETSSEVF